MLFPLPTPLPVFALLTTPGSELPAVCIGVSPGQAAKSVLFHTVRFGALSCWLDDSSTGEWAVPLRGGAAGERGAAEEGGDAGEGGLQGRGRPEGEVLQERGLWGKVANPGGAAGRGFRLQGRGRAAGKRAGLQKGGVISGKYKACEKGLLDYRLQVRAPGKGKGCVAGQG